MRQAQTRAKDKNNINISSLLNLLEIYTLWVLFICHFCYPMGVNS